MNSRQIISRVPADFHTIILHKIEHKMQMRKVFDEFNKKKQYNCWGCRKRTIDIAETFPSFATEYFFSREYEKAGPYSQYGILCCWRYMDTQRACDISHNRQAYYKEYYNKIAVHVEAPSDDDDDDDIYIRST